MFSPRRRLGGTLAVVAAGLLLGAQFVPVDRSNPPVRRDVGAPPAVAALLRAACYDCHSRETRWPWYSRVAPVSWLVADHVKEGRRELDFSDWPAVDLGAQDELLRGIAKEVGRGEMPLAGYPWLHPAARLDAAQRETIVAWARGG
jgi:hypothetical protein